MKIAPNKLLVPCLTTAVILAGSFGPALSKCVKKHPIFGVDVYLDDKHCQEKVVPKKAVKKTSKKTAALKQDAPAKAATLPDANPQIREMQGLLTELGYKPGPADGVQGPTTTKALDKFHTAMSLPKTTSVANTLILLNRAAGK